LLPDDASSLHNIFREYNHLLDRIDLSPRLTMKAEWLGISWRTDSIDGGSY
jgi:hypothetical protein